MDTSVQSARREQNGAVDFRQRRVSEVPRAVPDVPPGEHYRPLNVRKGGDGVANFLGLFSLGLGISQIVAPDSVARLIGVRPTDQTRSTMRAVGMREIASGVGILGHQQHRADWLWSRVAGDAMDLVMLGRAMSNDRNERSRTTAAVAAVLGVTALDVMSAQQVSKRTGSLVGGKSDDNGRGPGAGGRENGRVRYGAGRSTIPRGRMRGDSQGRRVTNIVTINKTPEELYAFWRNFENLPRFMRHLVSVQDTGNGRSRWKAMAPAGATVEWDAQITEDRPNELISWRSLPGADVRNSGTVTFTRAAGGRGTEVRVDLEYRPPAGKLGSMVAMLFREEPGQQVHDDLRAFKQVMEIGEVVLSDATKRKGMHPAQPSNEPVEAKV